MVIFKIIIFSFLFGLFGLFLYAISPFIEFKNEMGNYLTNINIHGNPISFNGVFLNFILGASGGLVISFIQNFNDNKKIFLWGIVGVISVSSGADYYHPIHSLLIAMIVTLAVYKSFNYFAYL